MTATKPEIGTDSAATIYAAVESVRTTLEKMVRPLTDTVTRVEPLDTRLTNVESILVEILTTLQRLDVTATQTGDQTIMSNEYLTSLLNKANDIQAQGVESLVQHNMTQMTLGTFVGWFTPILDDFRESAILPTMAMIDGKTQLLLDSHLKIEKMVENIQGVVTPMLDKLEKSPILKMLGVNDK